MYRRVLLGAALLCACISANSARAADPFVIAGQVNNGLNTVNQPISGSFSSVTDAVNFFQTANLTRISSAYNAGTNGVGGSGVAANINYLGVTASLSFDINSNTLTFQVPVAGINQSFTGATRSQSVSQLVSFLIGNGGSTLNTLEKYLVTSSPISPLAGNPSSLQGQIIGQTFSSGAFNTGGNATTTSRSGGEFGVSVSGGQFTSGDYKGSNVSVPISYTYKFANPRWQLQFNLPLTYQTIAKAQTFAGQIGVGLQIPVLPNTDWYLIPSASIGATGSLDLGAAGGVYSFALSSRYTYHAPYQLDLTIGNMVGQFNSLAFHIDKYTLDPGVTTTAVKNGIELEWTTPLTVWGEPMSVRLGYANTQAFGTKLYINNYNDIVLDFGTSTTADAPFYKQVRLGVNYTFASDYKAFNFSFGYTF